MNNTNRIFGLLFFVAFVLTVSSQAGCYYDNEAYLYPDGGGCDTTGTAYAATILPIMDTYCNSGSCHSSSANSGDVTLDNYASTVAWVENGKLLKSIQHASGASAMPKNSSKLSACNITKVAHWIEIGYPNN